MANNKHALIRYRALDTCFSNQKIRYAFKDLLEAVNKALENYDSETNGVSRAQLYEDIKFMESKAGWNIDLDRTKDGRDVYYQYANTSFSINNMPLNDVEVNHLKEAIELLGHFKGMPQFEWVNEVIPKIQQGMKPKKQKAIISFDANQYLKGIEYLSELFNAILYKKTLSITYQDFKAPEPYSLEFHPYYLKQYNNRWFVFGYNPHRDRPDWNLALDRIVGISNNTTKYTPNKDIDWEEYFEDIIGVTQPENSNIEKIELSFNRDAAKYILTKPLHGSQKKLKEDDKGLLISLEVKLNNELENLILSFGNKVTILKPLSLQRKIKNNLLQALENYSS